MHKMDFALITYNGWFALNPNQTKSAQINDKYKDDIIGLNIHFGGNEGLVDCKRSHDFSNNKPFNKITVLMFIREGKQKSTTSPFRFFVWMCKQE